MIHLTRLGRLSALVTPVIAFLAIVGATLLAPDFSWAGDALSDLGASGAETAWLFNGGLILASFLGLPVAVGFYLGATLTLWIAGTGDVLAGKTRFGLVAIWLANIHILNWLLWAAGARIGPGLAIPETVGAALFAAWVIARGRRMAATTATL